MKDLQIKKLYYSISEVSRMVGLEQYVLRYWETEFEQLRPQKNRAGNRIYTEKDIELIRLIKRLTREERYTIEGARQILSTVNDGGDLQGPPPPGGEETLHATSLLRELRDRLCELRERIAVGGLADDRVATTAQKDRDPAEGLFGTERSAAR